MLSIVLIWVVTAAASLCLGGFLLSCCGAHLPLRTGDRFMAVLWTGFLSWGVLLLATACLTPLSPAAGISGAAGICSLCLAAPGTRRELGRIAGGVRPLLLMPTSATLAAAVGLVSVQTISNRDAISYHYDLILHLSRFGLPTGLVLIHDRLGYVSSWFALPALFNHGPLAGRTATVQNGFALLLAAAILQLSLWRILSGRGRIADFFSAAAFPLAMIFPLLLNYTVNSTPDFGVLVITLVIAWLMLVLDDALPGGKGVAGGRVFLLPVFFAAVAFTVKSIALPLLPAAFAYGWARNRFSLPTALGASVLTFVTVLPVLAASSILSGCPLYPVPLCFDVPWTMGRGTISVGTFLRATREGYLFQASDSLIAGGIFLVFAAAALAAVTWRHRRRLKPAWPVTAVGTAGLAFLVAALPTPRFGWGYMALLAASPLLVYFDEVRSFVNSRVRGRFDGMRSLVFSLAVTLLFIVPPSLCFDTRSETMLFSAIARGDVPGESRSRLLLPPVIPKIRFNDDNTAALFVPEDISEKADFGLERGFFYHLSPAAGIRFRDEAVGPAAGFEFSGR